MDNTNKMDWSPLLAICDENDLLLYVRGREDVDYAVGRAITDEEWKRILQTSAWTNDNENIQNLISSLVENAIKEAEIVG